MERSSELTSILAMSDKECAEFLSGFMNRLAPARGNGKMKASSVLTVAMCKAIAALEHQALWIPFSSGNIPEDNEEILVTLVSESGELVKDFAIFHKKNENESVQELIDKVVGHDFDRRYCFYNCISSDNNIIGVIDTSRCWPEFEPIEKVTAWLPSPLEYTEPEESTDKEENK